MVGPGGFEPPTYGSLPQSFLSSRLGPQTHSVGLELRPRRGPPLCLAEPRAHQRSSTNGSLGEFLILTDSVETVQELTSWKLRCVECGNEWVLKVSYDISDFEKLYHYCKTCKKNTFHEIV